MAYPNPTINDKNTVTEILLHKIFTVLAASAAFVAPSYTTVERDAIVSPLEGQLIMNTTTQTLEIYMSGEWSAFLING